MKNLLLIAAFLFTGYFGFAQQVYVQSYTKSNGTYVQGHYRTAPNNTVNDNWSTVGNVNPHTGQAGYKPRESTYTPPKTYSYSDNTYSTPTIKTNIPKSTYNNTSTSFPKSTYNNTSTSFPAYKPVKLPKYNY